MLAFANSSHIIAPKGIFVKGNFVIFRVYFLCENIPENAAKLRFIELTLEVQNAKCKVQNGGVGKADD